MVGIKFFSEATLIAAKEADNCIYWADRLPAPYNELKERLAFKCIEEAYRWGEAYFAGQT